ncbi:hypothetical protein J4214_02065 [Candidatus Woesearchaeota archaeon]|nr:hypothetical protein [Candidatus Woesearchaeota archaeon]
MFNLSYEEVIERIKNSSNLSEKEINERINQKLEKLSDLISKAGAAHILANELNINIFENVPKDLKINKLIPGMSSVNIMGKVVDIYGIREYIKENRNGKIGSLLLGDETELIRVVLWDTNHISLIEKSEINHGRVLNIKNAYVKQNINGNKELHLGNRSSIEFSTKEINVSSNGYSTNEKWTRPNFELKKISEINENEMVKINGNVVYMFEPRFYEGCVECNRKVENGKCIEHNKGTKNVPVLNFYIDDGSANIKVVAFREQATKIMNGHAQKDNIEQINFNEVKNSILGSKYIIEGKVVKNSFSNDIELIANNIHHANINSELKDLMDNIENNN